MFKVEYYVDDNRLGESLRRLAGIIRGTPTPVPVVNAEAKKSGDGEFKIEAKTEGRLVDIFEDWLSSTDKSTLVARDVKEFMASIGRSVLSYNHVISQAKKRGLIKQVGVGSSSSYKVTR